MKRTKKLQILGILALVICLFSTVTAIVLLTLSPQKSSTWTQKIEPSDLEVTSCTHVILKDKVKTTLVLTNPTSKTVNANVIVYYEPELAQHTFNVTITAGATETYNFNEKLDPLKLESVSIFISEY